MWFAIVIVFIAMPLIELALLLTLASWTSPWLTLGLVVVTGVVGGLLAKWQGLRTIRRVREQMRDGRIPAGEVLDGAMILTASLLLMTPGVITDLIGFSLLIPPIRALYKIWGAQYLTNAIQGPRWTLFPQRRPSDAPPPSGKPRSRAPQPPKVLEGSATRKD